MERIDFPLNGHLRETDIFRTVYADGTSLVRVQEDLEGFHLLELATLDWRLNCVQETWDLSGSGIFLSTANKDLPSLRIDEDLDGDRIYRVFNFLHPEKLVILDPKRGKNLLSNILNNSTHDLLSLEDFNQLRSKFIENQVRQLQEVNKNAAQARTNRPIRPASQGPLRRPKQPVNQQTPPVDDAVYFADD